MNNENIKPRLRFAPSPTGGLHIGTARTALFNWLAAKSMAGKLILRIEDTDIKRSNKLFEESIICDLGWLGITWDEFYRQSDRMESFKDYAYKLLDEGKAYRCFCSPERLEELKSVQYAEGKMSKYDNRCRDLSPEEIENEIADGKSFAIRFKIEPCEIIFNDLIRGEIRFISDVFGDFVILKSDGTPSYNFAVVIDDHEMNITHILRGEDHITNTARQILLFKSLRFEIPEFAHLSMILGKDGSKLSKRHGSQTITEFRDEGYVKEALGNYLALLSWASRTGNEIFNITEITGEFKLSDVSKSPAIFDLDKLNWINGNHIRQKTVDELFKLVLPFILKSQIIGEKDLQKEEVKIKLIRCMHAFKDKLKVLADLPDLIKDFFVVKIAGYSDEALQILKLESSLKVINSMLEKVNKLKGQKGFSQEEGFNEESCREIINNLGIELKEYGIKGKLLYMPIRAAITGQTHGPELPKVMSILGLTNCVERINQTSNFLNLLNKS